MTAYKVKAVLNGMYMLHHAGLQSQPQELHLFEQAQHFVAGEVTVIVRIPLSKQLCSMRQRLILHVA